MTTSTTHTLVVHQMRADNCFTYLIADSDTREAALVDPRADRVLDYVRELEERGLRLRLVIETHTHADHIRDLPHLIHNRFVQNVGPLTIYAAKEVMTLLTDNLFNGTADAACFGCLAYNAWLHAIGVGLCGGTGFWLGNHTRFRSLARSKDSVKSDHSLTPLASR